MEKKKNTNVVAIIGFIFAILSIFTLGFVSSIGLTLSIIGLCIYKKYKSGLKGLAIAGVVISSIFLVLFWVLVFTIPDNTDTNAQFKEQEKAAKEELVKKKSALKDVTVTDFSLLTAEEAKKWCTDNDLKCEVKSEYSDEYPAGSIIKQSVEANTVVKEKSYMEVTYSLGHKKTAEEIAEEEKAAFKASCQAYSYEEVSRNPDNYKGLPAVFRGKVAQVLESSYSSSIELRVNVTEGAYGWWDDTIYVTYTMPQGSSRILDDDIITIYGTLDGLKSYTAVLGNTITLPKVNAKYIEY